MYPARFDGIFQSAKRQPVIDTAIHSSLETATIFYS